MHSKVILSTQLRDSVSLYQMCCLQCKHFLALCRRTEALFIRPAIMTHLTVCLSVVRKLHISEMSHITPHLIHCGLSTSRDSITSSVYIRHNYDIDCICCCWMSHRSTVFSNVLLLVLMFGYC